MKTLIAATVLGLAFSATANAEMGNRNVKEFRSLKDGSTLVVFNDGKMGVQDRLERAKSVKSGTPLETKDGRTIAMVGNETARVNALRPRGQ